MHVYTNYTHISHNTENPRWRWIHEDSLMLIMTNVWRSSLIWKEVNKNLYFRRNALNKKFSSKNHYTDFQWILPEIFITFLISIYVHIILYSMWKQSRLVYWNKVQNPIEKVETVNDHFPLVSLTKVTCVSSFFQ